MGCRFDRADGCESDYRRAVGGEADMARHRGSEAKDPQRTSRSGWLLRFISRWPVALC